MPDSKAKTAPRTRTPPKRVRKEVAALAKIAVVGIPASGKTTYFRFLSGHFGLNLPILFVPGRPEGVAMPVYGDMNQDVVLEETTYELTDGRKADAGLEATTRYYVSHPMQDPKKLFVELAAGRDEQGVLTKYPLPTKYNQFVEMKMRFRFGQAGSDGGSRPMELTTIDEAGGIISDYFTYDRLWIDEAGDEVTERMCRVIPKFDTWKADRKELWRRGLTLLGRFLQDADGIILLLSPSLPSLRDQAQQVNLARGVFRFVTERKLPLVIAVSKADKLREFSEEIERAAKDRQFRSAFDTPDFLLRRDGASMGTILIANEGKQITAKEDVFLISSAVASSEGAPLLLNDAGQPIPAAETGGVGVPIMVNTTLPLARACERILEQRSTGGE
ncbi:MAG TPA: hypothetical protein VGX00_01330 [Thermoplasmata archaeon]|nr:hypothetical protein [Thermoplasmata archaeon]